MENIKRLSRKPSSPKTIKQPQYEDMDEKEGLKRDKKGNVIYVDIERTKEHDAKGYGDTIPTKEHTEKIVRDRKSQAGGNTQDSKGTEGWEDPPERVKLPRDTQEGGSKFHFGHTHGKRGERAEGGRQGYGEIKPKTTKEQREVLGSTIGKPVKGGMSSGKIPTTDAKGKKRERAESKIEPHPDLKVGKPSKELDIADGGETDYTGELTGEGGGKTGGSDALGEDTYDGTQGDKRSEGRGSGTTSTTTGQKGSASAFPYAHPPSHFYKGKKPIKDSKGKITGYTKGTWTKVPESLIRTNLDATVTEQGAKKERHHLEGTDKKTGITAQEVYDSTKHGESNIRTRADYEKHKDREDEFDMTKIESEEKQARLDKDKEQKKTQTRLTERKGREKDETAYKTEMFGGNNHSKRTWNAKTPEEKAKDIKLWKESKSEETKKSMYLVGQRLLSIRLKSLK